MVADVDGRTIIRNVNRYLEHLKCHLAKSQVKKCTRCVLSFTHKGAMKVHLMYDHVSMKHKKLRPMCKGNTKIPKPKVNCQFVHYQLLSSSKFAFSPNLLPIGKPFSIWSNTIMFRCLWEMETFAWSAMLTLRNTVISRKIYRILIQFMTRW